MLRKGFRDEMKRKIEIFLCCKGNQLFPKILSTRTNDLVKIGFRLDADFPENPIFYYLMMHSEL